MEHYKIHILVEFQWGFDPMGFAVLVEVKTLLPDIKIGFEWSNEKRHNKQHNNCTRWLSLLIILKPIANLLRNMLEKYSCNIVNSAMN